MFRTSRGYGQRVGVLLPMALAVVAAWQAMEPPGSSTALAQGAATSEPTAGVPRLVLSFALYGSTPSLAWSPSGDRLAFNAAYDYFGYETQVSAHAEELGLWVYERDTEAAHRLVAEQRYHPAWLGEERIASGCSPYETCTEGLFVTGLDGSDTRVLDSGVYHTLAAGDEQVLFYNGFPGYTHWNRIDVATGNRETGLAGTCSWEPPPSLFVDQCVQSVGDVSVAVDASTGLWVRYGEGPTHQVDTTPPYSYGSSAWDCAEDHSGPVAPCLSPDGRQVAYVASAGPGGLLLRVHELPTAEEAAAAAPWPAATAPAPTPWPAAAAPEPAPADLLEPPATGPQSWTMLAPSASPLQSGATPPVDGQPSRAYLGVDFYGDTPSLAWSPDGHRLVFSVAFESSSGRGEWDSAYAAVADELGLFVADLEAGTVERVTAEQRYHPVWVDDGSVASVCSWSGECTQGLALTGTSGATRMLLSSAVSNLAPAGPGQVLYFDDESASWGRMDVASGQMEPDLAASCNWEPPRSLVGEQTDQCVQHVGDVRVWAQAGTGLYAQVGAGAPIRLDPSPPWLYEGGTGWGCSAEEAGGPVPPCLSPDGRHVAYVTRGLLGLSLHLLEIPR